jgi:hypothetical protein
MAGRLTLIRGDCQMLFDLLDPEQLMHFAVTSQQPASWSVATRTVEHFVLDRVAFLGAQ